jgi:hypothetical protein
MNAKSNADGTRRGGLSAAVLETLVGAGRARVILPITDPYVVHHGALGSFATVYLDDAGEATSVASAAAAVAGIAAVYDKETGCARFELPPDRVGDLIIIGETHTVLGKSPEEHDLSLLEEPLRSHGGVSEQTGAVRDQPSARRCVGAVGWRRPRTCATSICSTTSSTGSVDGPRRMRAAAMLALVCLAGCATTSGRGTHERSRSRP